MKATTVRQLAKYLNKLPQDTPIMTYSTYNRKHVKGIIVKPYNFDGMDFDCYHSHFKQKSDIPAGNYLLIDTDGGE